MGKRNHDGNRNISKGHAGSFVNLLRVLQTKYNVNIWFSSVDDFRMFIYTWCKRRLVTIVDGDPVRFDRKQGRDV